MPHVMKWVHDNKLNLLIIAGVLIIVGSLMFGARAIVANNVTPNTDTSHVAVAPKIKPVPVSHESRQLARTLSTEQTTVSRLSSPMSDTEARLVHILATYQ